MNILPVYIHTTVSRFALAFKAWPNNDTCGNIAASTGVVVFKHVAPHPMGYRQIRHEVTQVHR